MARTAGSCCRAFTVKSITESCLRMRSLMGDVQGWERCKDGEMSGNALDYKRRFV